MLRSRTTVLLAILALALGSLGLVGCSSDDDPAEEEEAAAEESTSEDSGGEEPDDALAGTWENADPVYYAEITFESDGTGIIHDIDGEQAPMTWTLVDEYLEVEIEIDDMTDMTGGGFTWIEEGSEFSWDADGTYTKVE
jgi:hypothetical protein